MVQQIQHFEGFDEKPDEFSRSARKRDAQEIRRQVENVANLGDQAFKNISLDPDVREAIEKARAMKINSDERRRQLQYAARLQRGVETQDLGEQIALLGASSKEDPDTMRFERLRSELISGGVSVVNSLCSLCKDLDRKKLMSLVRKAKAEFKQEQQTENTDVKIQKPESRRLYRYIKDEIHKAGIQVPETLLEKHS